MSSLPKWYATEGPECDVVISTRVRLARNLGQYPFPVELTTERKEELCQLIKAAVDLRCHYVGKFDYLQMDKVPPLHAQSMVEHHIISPAFAECRPGTALFVTADESVGIMVNEEDHLRIQVMHPGLMLEDAYSIADKIDIALNEELHFAFDDRLGHITQCPSNLGTGLRASVMLHLPALEEKGILQQLAKTVSKLGLVIRGIYGEGSRSKAAIYQLSNQITLGITEKSAIQNLKGITEQIIQKERTLRKSLLESVEFQDKLYRSLGILSHARTMGSDEAMALLTNILIGRTTDLFTHPSIGEIHGLITEIQPATIMLSEGNECTSTVRDRLRANKIRQVFGKEA